MTPCVMPCPVVVEAAVGANAPATSVSAMSSMDDGLVPGSRQNDSNRNKLRW